jgi:hypothetical protein
MEFIGDIAPAAAVFLTGTIAAGKLFADVREARRQTEQLWEKKLDKDLCEAQHRDVSKRLERIEAKIDRLGK